MQLGRDQGQNGFPDNFFRVISEEAGCCLIPAVDNSIQVLADNGIVGRLNNRCQPGSDLIGLAALTDVACYLRGPNYLAGCILDGRDGQRDVYDLAILPYSSRFVMVDLRTPSQLAQYLGLLAVQFGGDQLQNGLADDFLGRITEQTRCSRVPTGDDTAQILSDNGVVGGVHDGRKLQPRPVRQSILNGQRGSLGQQHKNVLVRQIKGSPIEFVMDLDERDHLSLPVNKRDAHG